MLGSLICLILVYIVGYVYYEMKFKVFLYNEKYNLYYIKRTTLYNLLENEKAKINKKYYCNSLKNVLK